ncbi:MAG: hypothetical protein HN909_09250, partial [Phycisphaerales bacterium]|nr:hypothetical protein [Phycisphaerales bacterium]
MRIAFAMLSVLILAGCEVPSATSDAPLKSVPLESGRVHKEPWDVHGI